MRRSGKWFVGVLTGVILATTGGLATAGEGNNAWLASMQAEADKALAQTAMRQADAGWKKPLPVSFGLDYTVVSDYVWRGLNFSEYAGEGREKLNHQASLTASYETERFGTFGANVWFEFYQGQSALDADSNCCLQEVDYTLSWSYDLSNLNEKIPLTFETGWILYQFPQASGDGKTTNEWYFSLALDDSKIFGTENAVLNPTFRYYLDCDDVRGSWLELAFSHDFAMKELGLKDTPVLKDMTLTPSLTLGWDHRFHSSDEVRKGNRLATVVYGLQLSYDLSSALDIPEKYGALALSGFLNYSQVASDALRKGDYMNDELYGGAGVSWSW
ncbi:MAG TPA: hypothetical protein PK082_01925 [Phycisphaerae bacterium]|nr:hypothetical protein [Phycisphaerae bacterium]